MNMFYNITWATPSSQPRITSCLPILNLKGFPRSREESNLRPSVREPEKNTGMKLRQPAHAQFHITKKTNIFHSFILKRPSVTAYHNYLDSSKQFGLKT